MMNENNITLSKPWRDFYNTLCWVMLDLSQQQYLLAWKLWLQQQNKKKSGQTRATALLKRMR